MIRNPYTVLLSVLVACGCALEKQTSQSVQMHDVRGDVQVSRSQHRQLARVAAQCEQIATPILVALDPAGEDSEISKINRLGGEGRLPLSRSTHRLLDLARHYSMATGYAYDFTTAGLADFWRDGTPETSVLADYLDHAGMRFVETGDAGYIAFTSPRIQIRPGDLPVAYALDVTAVELRRRTGVAFALQARGMMRRDGAFPDDENVGMDIALNIASKQTPLGRFAVREHDAVVVRALDGRRDVLIDPRSGRPAEGTRLVAVAGPLAVKAFVLAEALLVLGHVRGEQLLEQFPGYDVMLIPDDQTMTCWMTPDFRDHFAPAATLADVIRVWQTKARVTSAE